MSITHQSDVSGIWIYPIKSMRGVSLQEGVIAHGRLVGDRNWVVVDEHDAFMHQRDYPQMALVAVEVNDGGLVLSAEGLGACTVRKWGANASDEATFVELWRRAIPCTPCSDDVNRWLSNALGVQCRLMEFLPDTAGLHVPPSEINSSFQDALPFHITSESSLADLSARAGVEIPMNRFRPNIVIRGTEPYAEDGWDVLSVGSMNFSLGRVCLRCVMTTTDQRTGERDRYEPLRTLSKYRRHGSEVAFGNYYESQELFGSISIGEPVTWTLR